MRSLAYELVINSDPCINYIMEENSMTMQALVLAHAAYGHNHFFKNNYQFQLWTQPDHIIDYLAFAKTYVAECEERHGQDAVEHVLDAAHALMNQGVSRDLRPRPRNVAKHEQREGRAPARARGGHLRRHLPHAARDHAAKSTDELEPRSQSEQRRLGLPEENLLYFLEKNAPKLEDWQRELLRIVRLLSQYFYPQRQTKMMNEGCATFVHYEIMNRLYERGQLTDGTMLEFLHSHSSVIFQPAFNDRRFSGLNPYALGFAMMNDIRRICTEPTAEDREWFPDFAGNGDWMATLREAWAHFRDESFVLQFLSPKLIRDFRLFAVSDDAKEPAMAVKSIHDEQGYKDMRRRLVAPLRRLRPGPRPAGHRCRPLRQPPAGPHPPRAQRRAARQDRGRAHAAIPRPAVGLPRQARRAGRRGLPRAQGARGAADALRVLHRGACEQIIPAPRMPAQGAARELGADPAAPRLRFTLGGGAR